MLQDLGGLKEYPNYLVCRVYILGIVMMVLGIYSVFGYLDREGCSTWAGQSGLLVSCFFELIRVDDQRMGPESMHPLDLESL